jgi:hypothetical protein
LQGEYEAEMAAEIIFQKSLVMAARWVRFPLPNENWALRRVLAM